eukprot:m.162457 g.162457  ORF g.162457 m.162457 type:complete len:310 (+) comp21006_c2_seq3:275-1204(+)
MGEQFNLHAAAVVRQLYLEFASGSQVCPQNKAVLAFCHHTDVSEMLLPHERVDLGTLLRTKICIVVGHVAQVQPVRRCHLVRRCARNLCEKFFDVLQGQSTSSNFNYRANNPPHLIVEKARGSNPELKRRVVLFFGEEKIRLLLHQLHSSYDSHRRFGLATGAPKIGKVVFPQKQCTSVLHFGKIQRVVNGPAAVVFKGTQHWFGCLRYSTIRILPSPCLETGVKGDAHTLHAAHTHATLLQVLVAGSQHHVRTVELGHVALATLLGWARLAPDVRMKGVVQRMHARVRAGGEESHRWEQRRQMLQAVL